MGSPCNDLCDVAYPVIRLGTWVQFMIMSVSIVSYMEAGRPIGDIAFVLHVRLLLRAQRGERKFSQGLYVFRRSDFSIF